MNGKLTIDRAGRIVIPKPIREGLHLKPGDSLELENEGDQITLRPIRPQPTLKKELGVWVYQGETSDISIPDLIRREREDRLRRFAQ